jgi:hypothetical protein
MKRVYLAFQLTFILEIVVSANAQETFKSDLPEDEAILRGEDLILEVTRQRDRLPLRWAALIDFRVEATPDAENYLLVEGSSFLTEDKLLNRKVCCRKQREYQQDSDGFGDFPTQSFDWQSKSEHLSIANDRIELLPAGVIRQHLDPFMLWLVGSSCLTEGVKENYAELIFFGTSRKCMGSRESFRSKDIESTWTTAKIDAQDRKRKDAKVWTSMQVLHDRDLKMPIELSISVFDSSSQRKDGSYEGKLSDRTSAKWIKNEKYDVVLPTTVHSNWLGSGESLEASFLVRWLFDEDVPDETFTDPRTGKIVIPKFPPSENELSKIESDD